MIKPGGKDKVVPPTGKSQPLGQLLFCLHYSYRYCFVSRTDVPASLGTYAPRTASLADGPCLAAPALGRPLWMPVSPLLQGDYLSPRRQCRCLVPLPKWEGAVAPVWPKAVRLL
jgi:hypothetical protein